MTQRTRRGPRVSCHGLSEAAGQGKAGCHGSQRYRPYMMGALSSGMPLGRHEKRQALSMLSRCYCIGGVLACQHHFGAYTDASGPSTSMAYIPFRGHSRAGGNPVPLPTFLDARCRGHDTAASGKESLWSTTKWIDH